MVIGGATKLREAAARGNQRILWFVGSYAIGKERFAAVVAETVKNKNALNCKTIPWFDLVDHD